MSFALIGLAPNLIERTGVHTAIKKFDDMIRLADESERTLLRSLMHISNGVTTLAIVDSAESDEASYLLIPVDLDPQNPKSLPATLPERVRLLSEVCYYIAHKYQATCICMLLTDSGYYKSQIVHVEFDGLYSRLIEDFKAGIPDKAYTITF